MPHPCRPDLDAPARRLPGARSGHARARARAAIPLLAGCLLLAPPLTTEGAAQGTGSGPALGQGNEVGAALSLRPALSHAAGEPVGLLGLGAAIRVSPLLEVGGEGVFAVNEVRVSPSGSPDHLDLTLGYGGVHLRYHRPSSATTGRPGGWNAGLLLGAGTARVHSALANAEVGSDNFAVLEASVGHLWPLGRGLRGGVSAAYRTLAALDPLPGVEDGGLDGFSFSLVLHFLRDP